MVSCNFLGSVLNQNHYTSKVPDTNPPWCLVPASASMPHRSVGKSMLLLFRLRPWHGRQIGVIPRNTLRSKSGKVGTKPRKLQFTTKHSVVTMFLTWESLKLNHLPNPLSTQKKLCYLVILGLIADLSSRILYFCSCQTSLCHPWHGLSLPGDNASMLQVNKNPS